jgi:hypothetical protein
MSEPAPMYDVANRLEFYLELAGRAALSLAVCRKGFVVYDGDRRRFGDRTPRPPVDLKIIGKENSQ